MSKYNIEPANKHCYKNITSTIDDPGSSTSKSQSSINSLNNQLDNNSKYDNLPEPSTPSGQTVTATNGVRNIQYMGGTKNKIKVVFGKDKKMYYFMNNKRIKSPFS